VPIVNSLPLSVLRLCVPALAAALLGCQTAREHSEAAATLWLTLQGTELQAELVVPARAVLGFDHRPESAEERARLQEVVQTLRAGEELVGPAPAARCEQQTMRVQSPLLVVYDNRDRQRPAGAAPPSPTAVAPDFRALYVFECSNVAALDRLTPALLDHFPQLSGLNVLWQQTPLGTITTNMATLSLPSR
jgi:hypothetical protein